MLSSKGKTIAPSDKQGTLSIFHSRGYQKLADATRAFHFDFRDKTVLDIGSSTGGFIAFALEHGAKEIIAIEKGTRQMIEPLRHDSRISLYEKTSIFDVNLKSLNISAPDIILADVSFISLTEVLDYTGQNLSSPSTTFLVMLKPQFEAHSSELSRGILKNSATRRQIIKRFENWLKAHQFLIINKRDNQLPGKSGNLERFYLLKKVG